MRQLQNRVMEALPRAAMLLVAMGVLGLIGYILARGAPHISPALLTQQASLLRGTVGILPEMLNTLYLVALTLALVLPLGVGAAVYLQEYAKQGRLVRAITLAAEVLAGLPSIIYGLVGMLVFVQFFRLQMSLLAGALTMVIMTLPVVLRNTQESLRTVPNDCREGALALGAGRWHMVRTVVLPQAVPGMVTGCVLAVGRVVGESAALLYTAGMAHNLLTPLAALQPGSQGATLTIALYTYAKERGDFDTAFAIAAILLVFTGALQIGARAAGRCGKKKEQKNHAYHGK